MAQERERRSVLSPFEEQNLISEGYVSQEHELTSDGKRVLAYLLDILPPYHKGKWGEVFIPLMSKVVPSCVELIIVRNHSVFLSYRHDDYYKGWHAPGTYIGPRETLQDAVARCAEREMYCKVGFIRQLAVFSNHLSARFHDVSILVLCEILYGYGEPKGGKWFSECPDDMIAEHIQNWPVIERCFENV